MMAVSMTVNGRAVSRDIDERTLLVQFLRENLHLTGTHGGCDTSQCGACVVHVDGVAVKSCAMLALSAEGAEVLTIEGLAPRAAMRVLHAGDDSDRSRYGAPPGPSPR
jgi:aerobic carbon-monoxide dehydrogenase small subunit